MIYAQSSHYGLCVIPIRLAGLCVCVHAVYECLLRLQIVGLPIGGHKHYSVGMQSPTSSQSNSLSPAFPYD